MSDPQKPEDRAPRPGAGDAARTQQIPRLGRDGKPAGSQRTVADALREARQSPSSGSKPRRPAGPARPATGGPRSGDGAAAAPVTSGKPAPEAAETSAPEKTSAPQPSKTASSKAVPSKDGPRKAAPASSGATAPRTAPRDKAAPGAPRPEKAAPRTAAAPTQARRSGSGRTGTSTPTAADYARTTRESPDTTAVIPAVKDDTPAPSTPDPAAASTPAASSGRQARLRLTHVEPWSVTRLAFVVSVALMIVSVVAVTIFWVVLDLTGIWDQLNGTVTNVLSDSEGSFDLTDYLGLGRLVGLTLVFSAINVVLITAIATIAAHLYNLAAQLLGGIEVTFSDD